MITWTAAATKLLEDHLEGERATIRASGADATEVVDDLRRHIEEEARVAGITLLTESDVRRLLARTGRIEADGMQRTKEQPSGAAKFINTVGSVALYFCGIVLPLLALGLELGTHMCAGVLFDPLPTWWHVGLVALVPVAHLLTLRTLRHEAPANPRLLWGLNGLAIAVATAYAILFLPFTPFAAIGVIYFGIGLVPLAPMLSLIAGLFLNARLRRLAPLNHRRPWVWWIAFAGGLLVLAALAAPKQLTRHFSQLAVSDTPATSERGIRWLRRVGSESVLLGDCYGRTSRAENEINFSGAEPVPPEKARELYFRTTGRAFNSVPPPQVKYRNRSWAFLDDFEWDDAVGGDAVAGVVKGLSLASSRMDGTCNADEGWGYLEWTLEFRNESALAREARAQIALPPGGVVSRLTLWVDGEEREAAFAGRSQVKQAYRQVAVVQRRDPVLVTTCGPDRVMMQCFPIPPSGGLMKVRLGVTVPLRLEHLDEAVMEWPCFLERNFKYPASLRHALWLRSPQMTRSRGLKTQTDSGSGHVANGQITEESLARGDAVVRLRRDPSVQAVATTQSTASKPERVVQTFHEQAGSLPPRVVLVVDGSYAMRDFSREIAEVIRTLPGDADVRLFLAHDDRTLASPVSGADASATRLGGTRFVGGHDNVPALTRAWELAVEEPGSVLLWIHGPQPLLFDPAEALRQSMGWREGLEATKIIELCVAVGPDRVAEKLDGLKTFQTLPREGTPAERLNRLFRQWRGEAPVIDTTRMIAGSSGEVTSSEASQHVARLWARDEVVRLVALRKNAEAIALAAAYQLVTPVSGAVVLENAVQYQQNNLQPVDPSTVPMVPEPGTVTLMVLAALFFIVLTRIRRRSSCRAVTTSP